MHRKEIAGPCGHSMFHSLGKCRAVFSKHMRNLQGSTDRAVATPSYLLNFITQVFGVGVEARGVQVGPSGGHSKEEGESSSENVCAGPASQSLRFERIPPCDPERTKWEKLCLPLLFPKAGMVTGLGCGWFVREVVPGMAVS